VPRQLSQLSDISFSAPTQSQSLVYNGTSWSNQNISIESATDTIFTNLANGNSLVYSSGSWQNSTLQYSLNDLTDVTSTSPSSGQVLSFNGTGWAPAPSARILQVQSTTKTDSFATGAYAVGIGAEFADVTGVSVLITPASASNNVLVTVNGVMSASDSLQYVFLRLVRNLTTIGQSTGADVVNSSFFSRVSSSSDMMPFSISFLDSPASTETVTYKLQAANQDPARVVLFNRGIESNDYRGVTTITAMEVRS